jgi:hypothetical protein
MLQVSTTPLDVICPLDRRKLCVATRAIAQRRHLLFEAREIRLDGALTSRTHIDRPVGSWTRRRYALKRSPPNHGQYPVIHLAEPAVANLTAMTAEALISAHLALNSIHSRSHYVTSILLLIFGYLKFARCVDGLLTSQLTFWLGLAPRGQEALCDFAQKPFEASGVLAVTR